MSTIATTASYASDISTLLLSNSTDAQPPASASGTSAAGAADSSADSTRDPATRVDLSDKIKGILARASTDQDVANRLKAFVESRRSGNTDGTRQKPSSSDQSSTTDVNQAFEQLSGSTPAADDSYAPVKVGQNFAGGLKADGYTISAVGRASDGSFQVEIMGPDGKSFLDRRFGTSAEFSSFSGIGTGGSAQSYQQGNKEYITFSQNIAAATSVNVSSGGSTMSATSSGTRSDSVTFEVDFDTGAISMTHSESLSVSTAVQIGQPGSNFSTVA
jgi:hypothetical protein